MLGNGIDMYDLLPNVTQFDSDLYSTGQKFWVGVLEGRYPSPPIPRRRTKCYAPCPVYIYQNQLVFKSSDQSFYKIPDNEKIFVN